ncbi:hypothetical protein [Arthrobacter sp. NPDC092385]|uniref:hypothetical protein n=1 Tax=Arthrobacter sp. NPDC092385 TaxID=3363943 RepID=UPI003822061E
MPAVRPPHINEVMIAAADLEDAEFERDRLALACGEAIRRALSSGFTVDRISQAANLAEAEVLRLAEARSGNLDTAIGGSIISGPVPVDEPSLLSFRPAESGGMRWGDERDRTGLAGGIHREPDAAR